MILFIVLIATRVHGQTHITVQAGQVPLVITGVHLGITDGVVMLDSLMATRITTMHGVHRMGIVDMETAMVQT